MSNPLIKEWLTQPGGLADRLRQAREAANLTGKAVAETTGWAQSKVSRLENGKQPPTADDLATLGDLYRIGEGDRAHLAGLLEGLEQQRPDFRQRLRGGLATIQAAHTRLVAQATVVRNFEPCMVPGMVQTADYYRHLLTIITKVNPPGRDDRERAIAERMRRGQLIYDTSKRFDLLIGEPALRWLYCPPAVMLAQLTRLDSLVDSLPNVRLGIIPMGPVRTIPLVGFVTLDDTAVVEEFVAESKWSGDRGQQHHQIMDMLWDDAATGDDAKRLIQAAADALPDD